MKFRKFSRGDQYLFQVVDESGTVMLNSEEYTGNAGRNNGIQSVIDNAGNPDRYVPVEEDGNYYYTLRAGNNQEIGRSPIYGTSALRDQNMQSMMAADGGEAYGTDGRTDDYKPLYFYEVNGEGIEDGYDPFSAEGEHYFSYNLDGSVYLISEGYTSTASRDNGMDSVERNRANRDRYQEQQHPNGKYYFNLRAGNNQEIATSRWFDSEGEMQRIISRLTGSTAGTVRMAAVSIDAPPPPAEPKEKKKRKKRTTPKKPKAEKVYLDQGEYPVNDVTYQLFRSGNDKHYFTFKNAEGKTVLLNSDVRGFDTPEQAQAKLAQVHKYGLSESNYEGKMTRNGKYYFYLKGDDGKNIAKSFFYNTEEEMQAAIGGLLGDGAIVTASSESDGGSSREIDDYLPLAAYAAHLGAKSGVHDDFIAFEQGGEHYFAWVDGDDVLMRSEGYTTQKARDNGINSVLKNRDIDERYGVVEAEGGYCTTLKAGNHQEIARSGPYDDEAGALAWYKGRSGLAAAAAGLAAVGAGTLGGDADVSAKVDVSDHDKPKKVEKKVIKTGAAAAAVSAAASTSGRDSAKGAVSGGARSAAATTGGGGRLTGGDDDRSGGGFKWWWLLPLLLIPLLWLLLRGCGDADTTMGATPKTEVAKKPDADAEAMRLKREADERRAAEAQAKADQEAAAQAKADADRRAAEEAARKKAEADAAAKRRAAAVAAASGDCDCANKRARIFRIPDTAPKNITKLGSLPEFGNSHALSPSQFYQKLSDRYSSNADDRAYLDYVFRSMGYRGGFGDASAGLFSNTELARGTKGILGFGEYHGYAYSQLNTSEYDRQAFHIKAANGCDVHFMKTCGNFMYFCR